MPAKKVKKEEVIEETNVIDYKKENENLQNQINELKSMISGLVQNAKVGKINSDKDIDTDTVQEIPLNKMIRVCSTFIGGLNLKTSDNGKVYRFNRFGETRPIIYSDLIEIISHQRNFAEKGYFTILNDDVVKVNNLTTFYNKFLTKEQIENILDESEENIRYMLEGTTNMLKETVRDIVIKKIADKEDVDRAKVYVLNDIFGMDLFQVASDNYDSILNKQR